MAKRRADAAADEVAPPVDGVRMIGPADCGSVGVEGAVYEVIDGVVIVDPSHANAVARAGFRIEVEA